MRRVYKYTMQLDSIEATIPLPKNSRVLRADVNPSDHKQLAIWALIDPHTEEVEYRHFVICSTGFDDIPDRFSYIDTFIMHPFVFHVFEEVNG